MENQALFQKKKRNTIIDLMKGICIILMVVGHTDLVEESGFGSIYLFHMAVFFIASGFLFNSKYTDNIKMFGRFIVRKLKGLWIPFFLYTETFIILNNLFINLNIYLTTIPDSLDSSLNYSLSEYLSIKNILVSIPYTAMMDNATHMGGALWFFQTLFYVLAIYAIIDYIIKLFIKTRIAHLVLQGIIALLLSSIGFYCSLKDLFTNSWGRVASVYILIYIGVILKELDIIDKLFSISRKWIVNICIVLANTAIIIMCYQLIGTVAINKNSYVNPLFFVCVSLVGWFLVQSLSNILIYLNLRINRLIEYISRRSVSIIALHFLCFKIVSYLGIVYYGMDQRYLAAFPYLFKNGLWWLLYSIVGIVVPLGIDWVYLKTKRLVQIQLSN